MVSASPPSTVDVGKDFRSPLSERVLDPSKEWRAPKEEEKQWRESEEDKIKLQKGRIKKKSFSLYGPIDEREKWDPYSLEDKQGAHSKPATIFKFRF